MRYSDSTTSLFLKIIYNLGILEKKYYRLKLKTMINDFAIHLNIINSFG